MPPPRIPAAQSLLARADICSGCEVGRQSWHATQLSRGFSTTAQPAATRQQMKMWKWLRTLGKKYESHTPGEQKYMGYAQNQPFPLNSEFRSQPVLSEGARELIWDKVMRRGESIKAVSAELGVDMRRVAAVVRLKEVERDWITKGKPLARPYARAIMEMLPQSHFRAGEDNKPHEPINELHVHGWTMQQLFFPTPESRRFTREDAAKAFHERMLPADKRVPHPELIQLEKDRLQGHGEKAAEARFKQAAMESEQRMADREMRRMRQEEESTTKVDSGRFVFRFKDVNVDDVGSTGRSRKGTGWRYGVPFYDRRRGEIKIPTKVE